MELIRTVLPYAAAIIIGYFLGCINPAYIIAKIKGIDILAHGSHNPGASNATFTMGWRVGILVGLIDILKAFVAVKAAALLFPASPIIEAAAGVACVLGHIFPVTFKFRGGKGFASFLGIVLALDWRFFLILGAGIIIISFITNYIAVATLATVVAEPVMLALIKTQYIVAAIVCVASVIIIIRHFENIRRIAKGEEICVSEAFRKKS